MIATVDNVVADLQRANAELQRQLGEYRAERDEAFAQQTAIAEILQVINSSPGDLAPVFEAMLERATRLCEADGGTLWTFDGELFHPAVVYGVLNPAINGMRAPVRSGPGVSLARMVQGENVIHIVDVAVDKSYQANVEARTRTGAAGARSILAVALRKDDALLGAITTGRLQVRPYSDKQIALLQNFAAQAVIAMENARLITETREALDQQTATTEVLQVINSSPGDLAPVFDAMLEKAHTLCGAAFGALMTYDGESLRVVSGHNVPPAFEALGRQSFRPGPQNRLSDLIRGEQLIHVSDLREIAAAAPEDAMTRAAVDLGGIRTLLAVGLRKDDALLGVITAYRQEVQPFSDKQVALLQNFAAQAVIAMENARLITETREALEQQTATAEVLQVINASPGDLAPVFEAMLEKAHALCGAPLGSLVLYDGERLRAVATRGYPSEYDAIAREGGPAQLYGPLAGLLRGERYVGVADAAALPPNPLRRALVEIAGVRTALFVPLRKDGALLGYISFQRQEVLPFTEGQIGLLENFAAQAVIAIENARLITETREALEQQTATAEVLQVINSSPGDLAPVFDAMLEKAHNLCGIAHGSLELYDGQNFRAVASRGLSDSFVDQLRRGYPASDNPATRPLIDGEPFSHILDVTQHEFPFAPGPGDAVGARTLLCVPLRRDDKLLGMIASVRREVRPFTDKQIALLQNFAGQAVIAMENARLITETRVALEQQTATAEVLQVINSSPGDLAPVFDAMLERAMRLCGFDHGSLQTYDGQLFRAVAVRGLPEPLAEQLRGGYRPELWPPTLPLVAGARLVHVPDLTQEEQVEGVRLAVESGSRTLLFIPLRKDDALLGTIVAVRQEVRPFGEKEIALLQNFAAQAVIAMENARLITETREALDQQTATADVLGVINSSPGDLAPVFDAILEKAHALCGAAKGALVTCDGERFRAVATRGLSEAYAALLRAPDNPPGSPPQRLLDGESLVQVPDMGALAFPIPRAAAELEGIRTVLCRLSRDVHFISGLMIHRVIRGHVARLMSALGLVRFHNQVREQSSNGKGK